MSDELLSPASEVFEPERVQPAAITWREVAALAVMVALADVTLYRGEGFAGIALLLAVAPALLWCGAPRWQLHRSSLIVLSLLWLIGARLVWCGSELAVALGFALLSAFALSLTGQCPFVLRTIAFTASLVSSGYHGLLSYQGRLSAIRFSQRKGNSLAILLPVVTVSLFGLVFVMANPDLVKFVSQTLSDILSNFQSWLFSVLPWPTEVLFCIAAGWIGVGAMRPMWVTDEAADRRSELLPPPGEPTAGPLYAAFLNTLVSVIGLFAIYLVFEFKTLWFREFPKGFHYSGYAHEGAAWLTVALAMATLLLSAMFRGAVLDDPRVARLKGFAWLWSIENLLLGVSVFHRLWIYISFNGLTRMRMVGFLGISAVIVGFALVLWMIAQRRSFRWLVRRQLWTVSFAVYLYAVLPIDMWVNQFNVRRIMSGDSAPCVQITMHPTSAEGLRELVALTEHSDPVIRNGVRALVLKNSSHQPPRHWTAYQAAADDLQTQVQSQEQRWLQETPLVTLDATIETFRMWAYQWY